VSAAARRTCDTSMRLCQLTTSRVEHLLPRSTHTWPPSSKSRFHREFQRNSFSMGSPAPKRRTAMLAACCGSTSSSEATAHSVGCICGIRRRALNRGSTINGANALARPTAALRPSSGLKSQLCSQRGSDLELRFEKTYGSSLTWIYSSATWCGPWREPGSVFLIPPNDRRQRHRATQILISRPSDSPQLRSIW